MVGVMNSLISMYVKRDLLVCDHLEILTLTAAGYLWASEIFIDVLNGYL